MKKNSFDLQPTGANEKDLSNGTVEDGNKEASARSKGYNFQMTAFFMVAQMAGAGFLSLPKAVAGTGWVGMALIIVFCASVCFAAIRLGRCWIILEERYPEYREPARQPYMEIADKALGKIGRTVALVCVMGTLVGSTIVFMILIADMMADMVPYFTPCMWVLIVAAFLLPFSWLGSPKDFWQASVLAVVATVVAVIVILVKIVMQFAPEIEENPPPFAAPSFTSFALGFGAILFAFGGSSVFPTIQNDMKDRTKFSRGAVIAFIVILLMYAPVGFLGYYYIGSAVTSNILLSIELDIIVTVAISLQIVNLLGTFLISLSPVTQAVEDIFHIPQNFNIKRVISRSLIILFEVFVALAIPDFGLILNLIGGSTITCLSFIFPPLCYMRLVDNKSQKHWPERSIATWERIYLWGIVAVGVLGGISATVSALMAILNPESFGKSCFVNFYGTSNSSLNITEILEEPVVLMETA